MSTVAHEDLTAGDEPETAPAPGAAAAAETKPMWRRWVAGKDGQRALETYELLPYLRSVEDLWHRLCESDVPVRGADNPDVWGGAAVKLLYLLSHPPAAYRHLRSQPERFLEVIEAWGDENVPRERTLDAVTLAMQIHNGSHPAADAAAIAAPAV
jgi:hypothetical protein